MFDLRKFEDRIKLAKLLLDTGKEFTNPKTLILEIVD
jgi:hypothetical protein